MTEHHGCRRLLRGIPTRLQRYTICGVQCEALGHRRATKNQTAAAPTMRKARMADRMSSQRVCMAAGGYRARHRRPPAAALVSVRVQR